MAEREGFEPSEQVTPLNGLANRRTRPLCDLSVARRPESYHGPLAAPPRSGCPAGVTSAVGARRIARGAADGLGVLARCGPRPGCARLAAGLVLVEPWRAVVRPWRGGGPAVVWAWLGCRLGPWRRGGRRLCVVHEPWRFFAAEVHGTWAVGGRWLLGAGRVNPAGSLPLRCTRDSLGRFCGSARSRRCAPCNAGPVPGLRTPPRWRIRVRPHLCAPVVQTRRAPSGVAGRRAGTRGGDAGRGRGAGTRDGTAGRRRGAETRDGRAGRGVGMRGGDAGRGDARRDGGCGRAGTLGGVRR